MKTFVVTLLLFFFGVFSEAQVSSNVKAWDSGIPGTYEGTLESGDGNLPVTTFFFMDEVGKLVGKYDFGQSGNIDSGTLRNFRREGPFCATFSWEDTYGKGTLRILFAADCRSFSAFWGSSVKDTVFFWNGMKPLDEVQ